MSSTHDQRTSRTLGALLGVHAGDSLGATLEFQPWSSIIGLYPNGLREIVGGGPFHWAAGAATDDTDLTRAVLLAYADYYASKTKSADSSKDGTEFDVVEASANYAAKWNEGDWPNRRKGSRPVDIGNATREGLSNYKRTKDPSRSGAGQGSAGNGSLMRCIPTALFATPDARIQDSLAISAFTHDDVRCTVACAAYNEMVASLVRGESVKDAVEIGKNVARELNGKKVVDAIIEGEKIDLELVAREGPQKHNFTPSGFVLSSLKIAVAALVDERGFEEVLVDVVRLGGGE